MGRDKFWGARNFRKWQNLGSGKFLENGKFWGSDKFQGSGKIWGAHNFLEAINIRVVAKFGEPQIFGRDIFWGVAKSGEQQILESNKF